MTHMNKLALPLAASALMLAALGCAPRQAAEPAQEGQAAAGEAGRQLTLAFVTNNASDFWTIARKGVEKADEELPNVTVEFRMPGEGTAAEQRRVIDDLLAKGVDGIAISPVDPANQIDMLNRAAEQALVVTQDSDAPGSDRAAYVGTDNLAADRQAGEQLKKALPNGGRVMVFVGTADAQNAQDRISGIREVIEGTNIEIIDVRTDGTDRARAKANVADTLVKYPDIAGLVGIWSYNGPAILSAVREAGKINRVQIVCFDEEDQTLDGVKEGAIFATIVQQPFEFGYQSVKLMAEVLGGNRAAIPPNGLKIVDTLIITQDNVDELRVNLDRLRGRS